MNPINRFQLITNCGHHNYWLLGRQLDWILIQSYLNIILVEEVQRRNVRFTTLILIVIIITTKWIIFQCSFKLDKVSYV